MTTANCPPTSWIGLEELRPLLCWHLSHSSANEADIEDAVQETFLRAARYRDRLLSEDSLRPWLLRIAFNVLRDRARRDARLPRVDEGDEALEVVEGRELIPGDTHDDWMWVGPRQPLERGSAVQILNRAVSGLNEGDRRLIERYYGEQLTCEEAAVVWATSTAVVRIRLHRARRKLWRRLQPHFEAGGPALARDEVRRLPLRRASKVRRANETRVAGCGLMSLNRTSGRIKAAESAP